MKILEKKNRTNKNLLEWTRKIFNPGKLSIISTKRQKFINGKEKDAKRIIFSQIHLVEDFSTKVSKIGGESGPSFLPFHILAVRPQQKFLHKKFSVIFLHAQQLVQQAIHISCNFLRKKHIALLICVARNINCQKSPLEKLYHYTLKEGI